MSKPKIKTISIESLWDMDGYRVWIEDVFNPCNSCWGIVDVDGGALADEDRRNKNHLHFDVPESLKGRYKIYTEKSKMKHNKLTN